MNPIMFQIGNFSIRWYSVLILIGVITSYILLEKEGKKYNAPKDFIFNLLFWVVIFGLIGARIYYVIFKWSDYSHNLLNIFKFWEGGLAIHGGIIAGLITLVLYCKKYNVKLIKMTDMMVVPLILAQAIGRWGNFFNSEAYGNATTLATLKSHYIIPKFVIDGMYIEGAYHEPTFYYEFLWCILGFILLLLIRNRKKTKLGTLTAFYLTWYGIGRFFVESLRTDSLMLGGFKMAQIISIVYIIIGISLLIININKKEKEDLYKDTNLSLVKFK